MYRILFLSLMLGSLFLTSCAQGNAQSKPYELKVAVFKEQMKNTPGSILLDVRTPGEYADGHIEGALNIDWEGDDFSRQVAKLDKTKTYFMYCEAGSRSHDAAKEMRKSGFANVYELYGGSISWDQAGLPFVK